jgi:hypothetical protein
MASESSTYRLGAHQSASYTGTAGTISNAIGVGIDAVRVVCTTAAYVAIGKDPTATTSDVYMAAGVPEVFIARSGEKVSAIQVASGGSVHVTELS